MKRKRRALIFGVSGQDGSYLAEFLLEKDYEVYGLIRRKSETGTSRIDHILDRIRLIPGDLTDFSSVMHAIQISGADEIYNLAAQSHVGQSFHDPQYTMSVNGIGAINIFEAVRLHDPSIHIYQASSSEQFGEQGPDPKTEDTPFRPISPYACSKTYAHNMAITYRQAYTMPIFCGIAFNHESPRRGEDFVTRKITQAIAAIKEGTLDRLTLGNISSMRDWSHASDIIQGIWQIMQSEPGDYILASGAAYSVEDFANEAFAVAGLDPKQYLFISKDLIRPTDIQCLVGNFNKAYNAFGWTPTITFKELVREMVSHDQAEFSNSLKRL